MVQFMGRENMEDYNADFLVMLETWEAAAGFLSPAAVGKSSQSIDIARLLGWVDCHSVNGHMQINRTARACHAAHALIQAGHLSRNDLVDLSVRSARDIVERAQIRMEQLDRMAKEEKRPVNEIKEAKKDVGKAIKATIRQVNEGGVAQKDIRGQMDVNIYQAAKDAAPVGHQ